VRQLRGEQLSFGETNAQRVPTLTSLRRDAPLPRVLASRRSALELIARITLEFARGANRVATSTQFAVQRRGQRRARSFYASTTRESRWIRREKPRPRTHTDEAGLGASELAIPMPERGRILRRAASVACAGNVVGRIGAGNAAVSTGSDRHAAATSSRARGQRSKRQTAFG
jgi:hypothetical protein